MGGRTLDLRRGLWYNTAMEVCDVVIAATRPALRRDARLGLLLLAEHKRASERLHYAYGAFALAAVLAPWLYAPGDPRTRLAWFAGATLVAAALAARAYMTAS